MLFTRMSPFTNHRWFQQNALKIHRFLFYRIISVKAMSFYWPKRNNNGARRKKLKINSMLYFKAISCPFEHEVKQFVFINSRNAWEMHTCELLRDVILLKHHSTKLQVICCSYKLIKDLVNYQFPIHFQ